MVQKNKRRQELLNTALLFIGKAHEALNELEDVEKDKKYRPLVMDANLNLAKSISALDYIDKQENK